MTMFQDSASEPGEPLGITHQELTEMLEEFTDMNEAKVAVVGGDASMSEIFVNITSATFDKSANLVFTPRDNDSGALLLVEHNGEEDVVGFGYTVHSSERAVLFGIAPQYSGHSEVKLGQSQGVPEITILYEVTQKLAEDMAMPDEKVIIAFGTDKGENNRIEINPANFEYVDNEGVWLNDRPAKISEMPDLKRNTVALQIDGVGEAAIISCIRLNGKTLLLLRFQNHIWELHFPVPCAEEVFQLDQYLQNSLVLGDLPIYFTPDVVPQQVIQNVTDTPFSDN